jgi:cell division transport system permease protein
MILNKLGYLIKDGFKGIFIHGFMSFASVTIIIACLIVMGCFSLLAVNIDALIADLEQDNEIVAFVDEELSEDEARALEGQLKAVPNVRDVEFITREEAMDSFAEDYEAGLLEDIDSSVFRHRYAVYMNDISLMQQTRDDVMQVTGIAKVNAHLELAEGFITVRNVVSAISIVLVVLLVVVSVFIMTNTIKLATYGRREEIAIMKMVGATNSFIRLPFIIEGLVLGLVGGILAFFIQWGLYELISGSVMSGIAGTFIAVLPFTSLMYPVLAVFLGTGFLVGMFGGVIAIRNYLKV